MLARCISSSYISAMTYLISPAGDAVSAENGYLAELSLSIVSCLAGYAAKDRSRRLRFIREELNFAWKAGEPEGAIFRDDCESAGVQRAKAHLEALGLVVISAPGFDGDFNVENPSGCNNPVSDRIATLRKFREECANNGLCSRANPWAITGWDKKTDGEKFEYWRRRHPKAKWGFKHAGGRFRTVNREIYPPLMEDPENCGSQMTQAVREYDAPDAILQICLTLEASGQRYSDVAYGDALGWSGSGFGDWFWGRNKFERANYTKPIILPPEVREELIARFEDQPHPTQEGRTLMDRLRELGERRDPAARRELASITLFPSSRGTPFHYSTFNGHWFRPAMLMSGLLIHSDQGSRRPTCGWYRHAVYTSEMEEIYATTEDKEDISAKREELGEAFGHHSDQSSRYAPLIEQRRAIEKQFDMMENREERARRKREGFVLTKSDTLQDEEAEQLFANLPNRGIRR